MGGSASPRAQGGATPHSAEHAGERSPQTRRHAAGAALGGSAPSGEHYAAEHFPGHFPGPDHKGAHFAAKGQGADPWGAKGGYGGPYTPYGAGPPPAFFPGKGGYGPIKGLHFLLPPLCRCRDAPPGAAMGLAQKLHLGGG